MKYNRKGFTLIELLVVIAIIGLLSTLAVVSLNTARLKARDARRVSDIKQIQTALELFYNDKGVYPVQAAAVNLGEGTAVTLSKDIAANAGFAAAVSGSVYMAKVPKDPGTTHYIYAISTGTSYSIGFTLEEDNTTLGGDACAAVPSGISCT